MTTTTKTWLVVAGIVIITLIVIFLKGCNNSPSSTSQVGQSTQGNPTIIIKDSGATIRQQELLIVQSQATIEALQDSLGKLAEKLTGVKPQYIVMYKDRYKIKDTILYTTESDVYIIDSLDKALSKSQANIDSFIRGTSWIPVPRLFKDSGRFFKVEGSVTYHGVGVSNLELYNNNTITIGQRSNGFFKPTTMVVNVTQDNPMLTSSPIQTYYYNPKPPKWSLIAGPSVIFTGKTFSKGVGLTAGYVLFSK